MLRDWRRIALQVSTQGQVRTEVAWFNFAPGRMHWADHAGRDRTDRQRIKRKAARWAEGYRKMPLGERLAVVPAITDPPFFGAGPAPASRAANLSVRVRPDKASSRCRSDVPAGSRPPEQSHRQKGDSLAEGNPVGVDREADRAAVALV